MTLPPPPTFDDATLSRLLDAFFSPHEPELGEVAYRANLSVIQCAAWLAHPDTIRFIENLHTAFRIRSRLLVAQSLPHAIVSLTEAAKSTFPTERDASASVRARQLETARRASSRLIDLYQFESRRCDEPATHKPSRPRTSPLPAAPPMGEHTPSSPDVFTQATISSTAPAAAKVSPVEEPASPPSASALSNPTDSAMMKFEQQPPPFVTPAPSQSAPFLPITLHTPPPSPTPCPLARSP